jgi:hypothetical protein
MSKDKDRLDDTLAYIKRYISPDLAYSITGAMAGRTPAQVGAELSLSGAGFHNVGTSDQHRALRALILCHRTFLKAPWAVGAGGAPFDYNFHPDLPKTYFKNKTEAQIKNAILSYLPLRSANLEGLAKAATDIRNPTGQMTWETMQRDTDPFPNMPVCFDALKMWLFKAGFVSLRWLAKTGPTMTAQTVNNMLGDGEEITEDKLDDMPRGYLFNFHKSDRKDVCHWGVSLGGGWAAGSNTSSDWEGSPAPVNFRSGGSAYGEFTLASSLMVCKYKYTDTLRVPTAVTIRQINPQLVSTYF